MTTFQKYTIALSSIGLLLSLYYLYSIEKRLKRVEEEHTALIGPKNY